MFQVTAMNRIVISPNAWGCRLFNPLENISEGILSDPEYSFMAKKFLLINQDIEHWNRLFKIITIIQDLIKQGKQIKFINGLLHWDKCFFTNPENSKFIKNTIVAENLPDEDIVKFTKILYNQSQSIDLINWINPFTSLKNLSVDYISVNDSHPGLQSHKIFADIIFKRITQ